MQNISMVNSNGTGLRKQPATFGRMSLMLKYHITGALSLSGFKVPWGQTGTSEVMGRYSGVVPVASHWLMLPPRSGPWFRHVTGPSRLESLPAIRCLERQTRKRCPDYIRASPLSQQARQQLNWIRSRRQNATFEIGTAASSWGVPGSRRLVDS